VRMPAPDVPATFLSPRGTGALMATEINPWEPLTVSDWVPLAGYPDSDGQPMSDNTLQFRWIVTIQGNLDILFNDQPEVFVAADLLWYPLQGHSEICTAPDVFVAFERP